MNSKQIITALALSLAMGATAILPGTASAHGGGHEKRVTVFKRDQHDTHHGHRQRRYDHIDHWQLQRHRAARHRFAAPHDHHSHHRGRHGHQHYGQHHHRSHHDHYRVEHRHHKHHHPEEGLRVEIGYDFWL